MNDITVCMDPVCQLVPVIMLPSESRRASLRVSFNTTKTRLCSYLLFSLPHLFLVILHVLTLLYEDLQWMVNANMIMILPVSPDSNNQRPTVT